MELKTSYTISEERISEMLTGAFEGGSTYWIEGIISVDSPKNMEYLSDIFNDLKSHGYLLIKAAKHGPKSGWYLTREKVKRGLELMSRENAAHFADLIQENDDANTADVFLQYCLFGKIVFG